MRAGGRGRGARRLSTDSSSGAPGSGRLLGVVLWPCRSGPSGCRHCLPWPRNSARHGSSQLGPISAPGRRSPQAGARSRVQGRHYCGPGSRLRSRPRAVLAGRPLAWAFLFLQILLNFRRESSSVLLGTGEAEPPAVKQTAFLQEEEEAQGRSQRPGSSQRGWRRQGPSGAQAVGRVGGGARAKGRESRTLGLAGHPKEVSSPN